MTRKIVAQVPEKQVKKDLEKYRQRAIKLGATDAKAITTDDVVIDERVLAKCTYPKCSGYGTNANCPPYAMSPDEMRKVVSRFRYALLVKVEVPPEHTAGPEAIKKNLSQPYRLKLSKIIAKIEAEAFHDGYYLGLAFGSGTCKALFCADTECQALKAGQGCRFPLKARSTMEAVGMDAYAMATRAGWDIYPIGYATSPSAIPCGLRLGVVLIH